MQGGSPLQLKITMDWEKMPTDLSRCYECKETIFGDMMQLVVTIRDEKIYSKYKYCMSCYDQARRSDLPEEI